MARKRGGIAGFYDRNKGILQTLAPIAAGAIGGPLAGAAVGAAMRGFDRPGQSGIGLDLGQAAMGGITGYGAGKMGQALRGGVSGLFAPKGVPDISQTLAKTSVAKSAAEAAGEVAGGASDAAKAATPWWRSREGITALGQGAQVAASLIGSQRQLGMEREQMERQQREAEERARLMALFAPSILASFNTPYGSQYTGMGGR